MDKFDQQIIQRLQRNARESLAAIGGEIGLSRSAVAERIQRLEERGVIRGYTLRLGGSGERAVQAYFQLTLSPFRLDEIMPLIQRIMVFCHKAGSPFGMEELAGDQTLNSLGCPPALGRPDRRRPLSQSQPAQLIGQIRLHPTVSSSLLAIKPIRNRLKLYPKWARMAAHVPKCRRSMPSTIPISKMIKVAGEIAYCRCVAPKSMAVGTTPSTG